MTDAMAATFVQRPRRLARLIFGLLGAVLVIAGGFLVIRATRNPDLTELEGWQKWFGAPLTVTSDWPDRMTAIGAALALIVGAGLVTLCGALSWWVRTRRVSVPQHGLAVDADLLQTELGRIAVSDSAAWVFWQSLREPAKRFPRISETVEFGSRSVRVSSSISITTADLEGQSYAVPVALFSRGRLENGLRFSTAERVSSLSHVEAAAYSAAVVERLVRSAGRSAHRQYLHGPPGYDSLQSRVLEVMCCSRPGGLPSASEIARGIATLPCRPKKRILLYAAGTVVQYLAEQYPICVRIAGGGQDAGRVLIERTVIPSLREYKHRVDGWRRRLEVWRKRFIDAQRSMFGIPLHSIDYPTQWASRAASYHLNIRGPEGHYLAHQELRDGARAGHTLERRQLNLLTYAMTPRRGQRTGHLYVRDGRRFRSILFSCSFYERMPGSMSTAFVGAGTTTLIAIAVAFAVLFPSEGDGVTGLLQILLAFPLALTATSSFKSGAPFWGGDLGSRWATVITIGVLTASLLASTVGTTSTREQQVVYWSAILVISATNALVCFISWASRAATYHSFLGR